MPESTLQMWTQLLQTQDILTWISQMYMAHRGLAIIGYEIAWLLVIWSVLPWRLSKSGSWMGSLWTQIWIGSIYWVGAIWLIPASQWGDPYRNLLSYSLKSIFKMLLA